MVEAGLRIWPIYWPNILFGVISALALSLLGCHLVARRQILKALVISQSATLGIVIGAVVLIVFLGEHHHSYWELSSGFFLAGLIGTWTQWQMKSLNKDERPDWYLALYLILSALSFWLLSYYPALESHLLQSFFGDLVTLSRRECLMGSMIFSICIAVMLVFKDYFNEGAVFRLIGQNKKTDVIFDLIALTHLVLATYFLGFLLTISFLLLPAWLMSRIPVRGLRPFQASSLMLAVLASLGGFSWSLFNPRFSTTPTIILCLVLIGTLIMLLKRISMAAAK